MGPASTLGARPSIAFKDLSEFPLIMPQYGQIFRKLMEAQATLSQVKLNVVWEVSSVPAILDLVQGHPLHAVLAHSALLASGHEADFAARPIVLEPRGAPLTTTVWIATSAHRPRGPLLDRTLALLAELLLRDLAVRPTGGRSRSG